MAITPDAAAKMLAYDDARIAARLKSGQRLTVGERARLEALKGNPDATAAESIAYAHTWTELAAVLGVSRKTMHAWNKMKGAPKKWSNGTIPVAEWRTFCSAKGLKAGTVAAEDESDLDPLKRRKLLAEILTREHKLAVTKGEYLPVAEVAEAWAYNVGQATTLLRKKLEDEAPPILSGLDAIGIRQELGRVVDEFIALLNAGGGGME